METQDEQGGITDEVIGALWAETLARTGGVVAYSSVPVEMSDGTVAHSWSILFANGETWTVERAYTRSEALRFALIAKALEQRGFKPVA